MPDYHAPLDDMRFVLGEVLAMEELFALPAFESFSSDLIDAVLEEAGKFATEQLAPLNDVGDQQGCRIENGVVTTPTGNKQAYQQFVANGWNAVPFDPEYGGQGLPWMVATAVSEMWSGANMAFALCPLLTQGAVEAISMHGSEQQKTAYLDKLISGEWTGTMCLTEPQAGSDVGALTTLATAQDDHYLIKGQKIYITYGEHDFAQNIIHLVLARVPGAPAGYKGISLFVVPKMLADGSPNDLKALSIEHKLGIHASPTAVMSFGEDKGAVGYLVGQEGKGLNYMFTMMNNARLAVGVEGVAIAENAYQQAVAYASERVQGTPIDAPAGASIINHPDVKRMLMQIRANTQAMRALALYVAKHIDLSYHASGESAELSAGIVALLVPVLKAHATDLGVEMSSLALQVFGGIGYVEETGIAQNVRDARIAPIYEGTNGIQAIDLLTRKITSNNGAYVAAFCEQATRMVQSSQWQHPIQTALERLVATSTALAKAQQHNLKGALFVASDFTRLFGIVAGGVMLAASHRAATAGLQTHPDKEAFYHRKIETANYYMQHQLVHALGLEQSVMAAI